MEIYLTEEIFSRLLSSLSFQLSKDYAKDYPILVGVGISGIEMVGRMPSIIGKQEIQTYVCDVKRRGWEINEITNFPEVRGKHLLLCYARVDTGRTLMKLAEHALKNGAADVKTMSIAVRIGAECYPNYYSFMLRNEDNLLLLLDGYPPDLMKPYPPVHYTPLLLRNIQETDRGINWLVCGVAELDEVTVEDFLNDAKDSRIKCRVFVLEGDHKIVGLAQVFLYQDSIYLACLMVDKGHQGKGYGSKLVSFLVDWCRSNGLSSIELCSLVQRVKFYESLGFEKLRDQEFEKDCVMMKRALY